MPINTNLASLNVSKGNNSNNNLNCQNTFRGAHTNNMPKDTLELSNKKQKSKGIKIAVGALLTGAVGLGIYSIFKVPKFKPHKLPEHIDFKPAKTIEEAKKFAKEKLGIKVECFEKEDTLDLEILNYMNKGFVDFNNKTKGKLPLFNKANIRNLKNDDTIANMYWGKKSKKPTGEIEFNRSYFKNIDNEISEKKKVLSDLIKNFGENENKQKIEELIKKIDNGEIKALEEKTSTVNAFNNTLIEIDNSSPRKQLEHMIENEQYRKMLVDANCLIEKEGKLYCKMGKMEMPFEQEVLNNADVRIIDMLYGEFKNKIGYKKLLLEPVNLTPYGTVYHELGHLHDPKLSSRLTLKDLEKENLSEEAERWLFQDKYIAGNVSNYAKTDPGEFIAETFAAHYSDRKLPEAVLKLYEKLQGPPLL